MKNSNCLFFVSVDGYVAILDHITNQDIPFKYELVVRNKCNWEIKYIKRFKQQPNLLTTFQDAYNTILTNKVIWNLSCDA
ncbi:MAG: hypothetical protein E7Y34_01000 [Mycoplasma sp.]|nr:hypothetical protein [Mycoplasma sp.]